MQIRMPCSDEQTKVAELSLCGYCCKIAQPQQYSLRVGLSWVKRPHEVSLACCTWVVPPRYFCIRSATYLFSFMDCARRWKTRQHRRPRSSTRSSLDSRIAVGMGVWWLLGLGDETWETAGTHGARKWPLRLECRAYTTMS